MQDKALSDADSRYASVPEFTFGASKREDVFKRANPLGVPFPVSETSTAKYVDKPVSLRSYVAQVAASKFFWSHVLTQTLS